MKTLSATTELLGSGHLPFCEKQTATHQYLLLLVQTNLLGVAFIGRGGTSK